MSCKPAVSIVIPVFNSSWTLKRCLKSLSDQDFDQRYEIIVVDDCSTDDTCKIADEMSARLIRLRPHTGLIGQICNIGAKKARADVIVFLDSHFISFQKDWLKILYSYMKEEKCVLGFTNIVAASLLALPGVKDAEDWRTRVKNIKGSAERLAGHHVMIDKSVFFEVGGFAPWLRYSSDTELGRRLIKHGVKLRYAPDAAAYHFTNTTFTSLFVKRFHAGIGHVYIGSAHGFELSFIENAATLLRIILKVYRNILFFSIRQKEDNIRDIVRIVHNSGYLLGLVYGFISREKPTKTML